MAYEWFKLWHEMPDDPKWRTIARNTKQSISLVQAVWLQLLKSASQAQERGYYTIEVEDISSALNEPEEAIEAIIDAMQDKVLDGRHLLAWEKRQSDRSNYGNMSANNDQNDHQALSKANKKLSKSKLGYYYFISYEPSSAVSVAATGATGTTETTVVIRVGKSGNPWGRLKDLRVSSKNSNSTTAELRAVLPSHYGNLEDITKFLTPVPGRKGDFVLDETLNQLINNINLKNISTVDEAIGLLSGALVVPAGQKPLATTETTETTTEISVVTVATTEDKIREEKIRREIKGDARGGPEIATAAVMDLFAQEPRKALVAESKLSALSSPPELSQKKAQEAKDANEDSHTSFGHAVDDMSDPMALDEDWDTPSHSDDQLHPPTQTHQNSAHGVLSSSEGVDTPPAKKSAPEAATEVKACHVATDDGQESLLQEQLPPALEPKRRGRKRTKKTFGEYYQECKKLDIPWIPDNSTIWNFMEGAGLVDEMQVIALERFKEEHLTGTRKDKIQADWPGTFANSVKDCWYKIWYFDKTTNKPCWTSQGLQYKNFYESK